MKVVLSGGGTGGHIYPLFAVGEQIMDICAERGETPPNLYFYSDKNYYPELINNLGIKYRKVYAGKIRTYFSLQNFTDIFVSIFGVFASLYKMMAAYPDIVFAKGGYASFPVLLAARVFRVPVIIHESDTVPGRVTTWASNFAARSAVSFAKVAEDKRFKNVAYTGQPIMKSLIPPIDFDRKLYNGKPILLVIGGSQGSHTINNLIFLALPELLEKYNIIHIVGDNNLEEAQSEVEHILANNPNRADYNMYGHVNLSEIYPKANVAISRAGATTMFELALWQIPTVFIPITNSHDNHQASNAIEAVKAGWAKTIEEANLSVHMLLQILNEIIGSPESYNKFSNAAKDFGNRDAARIIANEILKILRTH